MLCTEHSVSLLSPRGPGHGRVPAATCLCCMSGSAAPIHLPPAFPGMLSQALLHPCSMIPHGGAVSSMCTRRVLQRLCMPRPPALCQHLAMLFTHERGSEASAPAANYPVLIFFGEKETRAFQTWPHLISCGRRGWRFPIASHKGKNNVCEWLGHSQPLPPA